LTKVILVKLRDRSYPLYIRADLLKQAGPLIRKAVPSRKVALVSTSFLFKTYGRSLMKSLQSSGFCADPILVPDGEIHKNEKTLFNILQKTASLRLQRDSGLISLGGGVLCDLAGLAAALYMRGIAYVQCPTTLLAQVDASIGGKTAIDFYGIKNLVGCFYQPKAVLIDPSVLVTLSERHFKTGLAELIKHGIIQDERLFRKIENNTDAILSRDLNLLPGLIARSCEIKAGIVSEDEREVGKRAWLNYGHTLGHALESYYGYRLLTHGEAIAYGMCFAAKLSAHLGVCSPSIAQRQVRLLKQVKLLRKIPRFNLEIVFRKMFLDKKARSGRILFILTRKLGLVTIKKNIPSSTIFSVLTQFQSETRKMP
jgi:3-dehydroquinate synthase